MTTVAERGRDAVVSPDFVPDEDFFAAAREPFGAVTIGMRIGPVEVRLAGLASHQADLLRTRFRPFVHDPGVAAAAAPAARLEVLLTRAGRSTFLALAPGGGEVYRMGRRAGGGVRDYWSYEFAGRLRAGARAAELALVEPSGPLFERGLENFLRTMTASYVLESGGLLLHAAAVVRDGRAYVFFGPSGAGKTTVTTLSPGDLVLGDDMTLIVPGPDGAYRAAGIPFGMAHHHVPDTDGAFPLAGLFRLVQSPAVSRQPLTGAAALAEVATCLPFVCHEREEADSALDIAGRVLRRVPAWKLHFRKDDSFWNVIQER